MKLPAWLRRRKRDTRAFEVVQEPITMNTLLCAYAACRVHYGSALHWEMSPADFYRVMEMVDGTRPKPYTERYDDTAHPWLMHCPVHIVSTDKVIIVAE